VNKLVQAIIRAVLGLLVGILSGAGIGALTFGLLALTGDTNRSLGGIGTIANSLQFSALTGAIAGSFYGGIVGFLNGLAGFHPIRAALSGLTVGGVFAAYLFFTSSDSGLQSALIWIVVTGGILGLATGFLIMLLTKKMTWLSNRSSNSE
jgi:hypothetical protein